MSNIAKTTALSLVIFPFFSCPAQSRSLNPKFEAASVRIAGPLGAVPGSSRSGSPIQTSPGALKMRNVSFFTCIQYAYQMPLQTVAPDWLKDIRLDIVAKAAEPVGDSELYTMLRTLLSDRMGVRAHMETREMSVYALTLAKGGPKFSESATDGPSDFRGANGVMIGQHLAMGDFARALSISFRRPVIDATGLKGHYDFRVDASPYMKEAAPDGKEPDQVDVVSILITALQEELGLKVEGRKDLVDTLVIYHAEKAPTED